MESSTGGDNKRTQGGVCEFLISLVSVGWDRRIQYSTPGSGAAAANLLHDIDVGGAVAIVLVERDVALGGDGVVGRACFHAGTDKGAGSLEGLFPRRGGLAGLAGCDAISGSIHTGRSC